MFKEYIKRSSYLKKIEPYIGKDVIKVLVGQRRVGKSNMLYQIIDHIKESNPKDFCIYINKELDEFSYIKHYKDLIKSWYN